MKRAIFLVVAIVLTSAASAKNVFLGKTSSADYAQVTLLNDSPYRLPNTTAPRHYTLRINPDFSNFEYVGQVIIQVVAQQAGVNQIILNSEDLSIFSVAVTYNDVNVLGLSVVDVVNNMIIIDLNTEMVYNPLEEAVYVINIEFIGYLRTDMYGFYRSWYSQDESQRWIAATQFAPTSARMAFPCYDEPSYKAVFEVIIERLTTYKSWSNMRLQSSSLLANGNYEDVFHPTPVMSTYLLAFIIAEFDSLEVTNVQGFLTHEIIARPEAISSQQGDYALQIGQAIVAAMDSYTGIAYASMDTNIKMTHASVPDLSFSAMENWGLATYRETNLMYDSVHTSSNFKQSIAGIMAHEIAHMWFGNLVTCEWWGSVWLNEGFARYFENLLANLVEEEMGFGTRFITDRIHTALFSDSVESAHPLTDLSLSSPDSILSHFSTITYNKGAAIIRMTEHLIGSEILRQGLQNYLLERSYNTAVPSDLFSALDTVAISTGATAAYGVGFTVDEYYRSWTEKAGYPLLYVHVNHTTGDMTIEQHRFDRNVGYSSITSNWIVPITFASAGNPDFTDTKPTHIIRETVSIINRGTVGDQWVVFNKQQTGFYRVNYDDYTWGLITLALRSDQRTLIHEYNRAQIVDDVFQLARSGLMTYTRAFNILSFLKNETEYAPWAAAITGLNWLRNRFAGTDLIQDLESMFAGWASNIMSDLTYYPISNESWMRSYLRSHLAPVLCSVSDVNCRTAASSQFSSLLNVGTEVPSDSRSWVYCNALRDGSIDDWNFLWNRLQSHNVESEKSIILQSLGCSSDTAALATLLDAITDDNTLVRPQDYTTAFSSAVAGNQVNTQIVFNWIQNNYAQLANAFTDVATPLSLIFARLLNEQEIQEFEAWALTNQVLLGSSYTAVVNGAAATRELITWTASVTADVSSYLENGYQADLTTVAPPTEVTTAPTTVSPPDVDIPIVPVDSGASAVLSSLLLSTVLALMASMFSGSY